jgi:hypothetical protein
MTRDDELTAVLNAVWFEAHNNPDFNVDLFIIEINSIFAQEWVSVSDRLPENGTTVDVWYDNELLDAERVPDVVYSCNTWYDIQMEDFLEPECIRCWRQLPPIPNDKEKDDEYI